MSNLFDHSNPFNKPNPYRGNYQHSITNRLDNSRRMINQQRIISNIPSHKLHDNIWQFNEDNLSKQSLFHDNPGRRRIGSEYSSKISIGNGLSSYGKNQRQSMGYQRKLENPFMRRSLMISQARFELDLQLELAYHHYQQEHPEGNSYDNQRKMQDRGRKSAYNAEYSNEDNSSARNSLVNSLKITFSNDAERNSYAGRKQIEEPKTVSPYNELGNSRKEILVNQSKIDLLKQIGEETMRGEEDTMQPPQELHLRGRTYKLCVTS